MARIGNYPSDDNISRSDKIVGTDLASGSTKNFTLGGVSDWLNSTGAIKVAGQSVYKFQTEGVNASDRLNATISLERFSGDGKPFSEITELIFSEDSITGEESNIYIASLVSRLVILSDLNAPNNFGVYTLTSFEEMLLEPGFYKAVLSFENGNGVLTDSNSYGFAAEGLESTGASWGNISGNINNQDDLIDLIDNQIGSIPTPPTPTLQSVTDEGNTTTNIIKTDAGFEAYRVGVRRVFLGGTSVNGQLLLDSGGTWDVNLTGGSNKYFAKGNFGIGTTAPQQKLHVGGVLMAQNIGGSYERSIGLFPGNYEQVLKYSGTGLIIQNSSNDNDLGAGGGNVVVKLSPYATNDRTTTLSLGNKNQQSLVHTSANGLLTINNATSGDVMAIDLNGNVGIGTTTPVEELHVVGDFRADRITATGLSSWMPDGSISGNIAYLSEAYVNSGLHFISDSNYNTIASGSSYSWNSSRTLRFTTQNGGTTWMVLDTLGNLGIGTTSPTRKLHVEGTSIIKAGTEGIDNPVLLVQNTIPYQSPFSQYLQVWKNSAGSNVTYLRADGTFLTSAGSTAKSFIATQSSTLSSIPFRASNSGTTGMYFPSAGVIGFANSASESMRITSDGKVGIGTTAPDAKLDINAANTESAFKILQPYAGDANADYIGELTINSTSRGGLKVEGKGQTTNSNAPLMLYGNDTADGGTARVVIKANTNSSTRTVMSVRNSSDSELLVVRGAGNVGIGTTAPQQKLHVEGTIRIGSDVDLSRYQGRLYTAQEIVLGTKSTEGANLTINTSNTKNAIGIRRPSSGTISVLKVRGYGTQDVYVDIDSDGNANFAGDVTIGKSASGAESDSNAVILNYEDSTATDGTLSITANPTGTSTAFVATDSRNGELFRVNTAKIEWNGGNAQISRSGVGTPYNFYGGSDINLYTGSTSWASITTESKPLYFGTTNRNSANLVIDTAGNVGIGTTAPTEKLHVQGTAPKIKLHNTSGFETYIEAYTGSGYSGININREFFINGYNGKTLWSAEGGLSIASQYFYGGYINFRKRGTTVNLAQIGLENGSNTYFNTGNFGIGTTSPSDKLDVQESTLGNDILNVGYTSNLSNFHGTGTVLKATSTYNATWDAYLPQVGIGTETPEHILDIRQKGPFEGILNVQGTHAQDTILKLESYYGLVELRNQGWLHLRQKNGRGGEFLIRTGLEGQTGWSAKFIVTNAGNVGIGTTAPAAKLHVNGDLISGASTSAGLWFNAASDRLRISGQIVLEKSGATIYVGYNANDLVFRTNNLERGRFNTAGNFGIGTAAPTSKLHVSGTALEQFRIETPGGPAGSGDTKGNVGDIAYDADFFYIKTANGWGRVPLDFGF
jgi:hypothetical protein